MSKAATAGKRRKVQSGNRSGSAIVVLLLIGAILLYAFGNKDLPKLFPRLAGWLNQNLPSTESLGHDFRSSSTSSDSEKSKASRHATEAILNKKKSPVSGRELAGQDREGAILEAEAENRGILGLGGSSSTRDKLDSSDRNELENLLNKVAK